MKVNINFFIFIILTSLVPLSILATQTSAIAQDSSSVPQTGQTQSYALGDDGDLQKGVQWPDPRFTDNGDGTVTDNLTKLIWLKNADCFGEKNWNDALDVSNNLADGQCGLSDGSIPDDWRLSNVRELLSLIDYGNLSPPLPSGHPFVDVQSGYYWSSTSSVFNSFTAWFVSTLSGYVSTLDKSDYNAYVWPVRSAD